MDLPRNPQKWFAHAKARANNAKDPLKKIVFDCAVWNSSGHGSSDRRDSRRCHASTKAASSRRASIPAAPPPAPRGHAQTHGGSNTTAEMPVRKLRLREMSGKMALLLLEEQEWNARRPQDLEMDASSGRSFDAVQQGCRISNTGLESGNRSRTYTIMRAATNNETAVTPII